MQAHWRYQLWTTGTFSVTSTIPLDWRKTYVVTGTLTQTDGDDYAHVYISRVCSYSGGDVVRCGVRDISGDLNLGLVEWISGSRRDRQAADHGRKSPGGGRDLRALAGWVCSRR